MGPSAAVFGLQLNPQCRHEYHSFFSRRCCSSEDEHNKKQAEQKATADEDYCRNEDHPRKRLKKFAMALQCDPVNRQQLVARLGLIHQMLRHPALPPKPCNRSLDSYSLRACLEINPMAALVQCAAASTLRRPGLELQHCSRASYILPSRGARRSCRITCSAADFSAGFPDENPYEVLGVNPLESFDKIKGSYTRRHKEAEKSGNEAALARLERAYDKIMMSQLTKRKKGLTFGAVEVSKNIKYADKMPLIPWGPKKAKSSKRDILINVGGSVLMSLWAVSQGSTDWKALQILIFGYVFQLFNKLKEYEPPDTPIYDEEDHNKQVAKGGKRLLRTFGLVFGCVTVASLAFTGLLNILEFVSGAIPLALYNSQEPFITVMSAALLFIIGSFYR